jgi:hypothetical protein
MADEGTFYYICSKCKKASDPIVTDNIVRHGEDIRVENKPEKSWQERFEYLARSKRCIHINSPERELEFREIISFISTLLKEERERWEAEMLIKLSRVFNEVNTKLSDSFNEAINLLDNPKE